MSHELHYTSAPRGLKPGAKGYCTVACTAHLPTPLAEKLESLSGYRQMFPADSPDAARNPVAISHIRLTVGGRDLSVISRVGFSGLDYTDRSNKYAHHVALDASERPEAGPAWTASSPGLLEAEWVGEPRVIPSGRRPSMGDHNPTPCVAWQAATGDAGWAGVLAESFLADSRRPAYLIHEPGTDLLPLLVEAIALVPRKARWDVTFNTYFTTLVPGTTCTWRGVLEGSPEVAQARRTPDALVIDLTHELPRAVGGALVHAARTGEVLDSGPSHQSTPLDPPTPAPSAKPVPLPNPTISPDPLPLPNRGRHVETYVTIPEIPGTSAANRSSSSSCNANDRRRLSLGAVAIVALVSMGLGGGMGFVLGQRGHIAPKMLAMGKTAPIGVSPKALKTPAHAKPKTSSTTSGARAAAAQSPATLPSAVLGVTPLTETAAKVADKKPHTPKTDDPSTQEPENTGKAPIAQNPKPPSTSGRMDDPIRPHFVGVLSAVENEFASGSNHKQWSVTTESPIKTVQIIGLEESLAKTARLGVRCREKQSLDIVKKRRDAGGGEHDETIGKFIWKNSTITYENKFSPQSNDLDAFYALCNCMLLVSFEGDEQDRYYAFIDPYPIESPLAIAGLDAKLRHKLVASDERQSKDRRDSPILMIDKISSRTGKPNLALKSNPVNPGSPPESWEILKGDPPVKELKIALDEKDTGIFIAFEEIARQMPEFLATCKKIDKDPVFSRLAKFQSLAVSCKKYTDKDLANPCMIKDLTSLIQDADAIVKDEYDSKSKTSEERGAENNAEVKAREQAIKDLRNFSRICRELDARAKFMEDSELHYSLCVKVGGKYFLASKPKSRPDRPNDVGASGATQKSLRNESLSKP